MTKATEKTTIALISKDISYIQSDIVEIKTGIKSLTGVFATKEELKVVAKETEARLCELENSSNTWKWVAPIFSAVISSAITFLLISYLQHSV